MYFNGAFSESLFTLYYSNRVVSKPLFTLYYSNRVVMHCNKVSFQELLDCFDNDLGNNLRITYEIYSICA